jgi:hypothetical protein
VASVVQPEIMFALRQLPKAISPAAPNAPAGATAARQTTAATAATTFPVPLTP